MRAFESGSGRPAIGCGALDHLPEDPATAFCGLEGGFALPAEMLSLGDLDGVPKGGLIGCGVLRGHASAGEMAQRQACNRSE